MHGSGEGHSSGPKSGDQHDGAINVGRWILNCICGLTCFACTASLAFGINGVIEHYGRKIPAGAIEKTQWAKGGTLITLQSGAQAFFPRGIEYADPDAPISLGRGDRVAKESGTFVYYVNDNAVSNRAYILRRHLYPPRTVLLTSLYFITALCYGMFFGFRGFVRGFLGSEKATGGTSSRGDSTSFLLDCILLPLACWGIILLAWLVFLFAINVIA